MSDLERVQKELTRLTERLRAVNSRKGAGAVAVRHYRRRVVTPRSSVTYQHRERRIS